MLMSDYILSTTLHYITLYYTTQHYSLHNTRAAMRNVRMDNCAMQLQLAIESLSRQISLTVQCAGYQVTECGIAGHARDV